MFKLFHNLLRDDFEDREPVEDLPLVEDTSVRDNTSIQLSSKNPLTLQIEKADLLWQQGKLQEAIGVYSRAIQQDPNSEIYQRFIVHLRQQNNIAQAYEQVASALKKQGQSDEAANYYRQAIITKTITSKATEKYLDVTPELPSLPEVADIRDSAFSFQPLLDRFAQQVRQSPAISNGKSPTLTAAGPEKITEGQKNSKVQWEATQSHMQEALEYCELQQWEQAAIACKKATQITPNLAEAYKIWGNALQRLNKTAEAMECYSKAVEIQPDLAEVYAGIAKLYSQQQKWKQAVRYYQKAIIIKPKFSQAYNNLAYVWEQFGELEKAKICRYRAKELEGEFPAITAENKQVSLDSLINDSSENISVANYLKMARELEQKNQWQEAASYYRKAIEFNLVTQNNSGVAQDNSQDEEHKLAQLARLKKVQKLIQTNTHHETLAPIKDLSELDTKDVLRQIQPPEEQIDQAIKNYYQQAKLKPNSAKIQTDLGNLYAKKRKWQSAIACYSKAIRINPEHAEAYMNLAKALAKTGKQEESAEKMYLALHLQPDLASAEEHLELGETLWKIGNRDHAIKCYKQAIALQPNVREAYHLLGERLEGIGKDKEATECYQKAVDINPYDTESHYRLGKKLAARQQWDGAVQAYRRVLELQPRYPEASQRLNHALSEKLKLDLLAKRS